MPLHFPEWRRELEQAIKRGEDIPIRVLLDQMEGEYSALEGELANLEGFFDNADPSEAASAEAPSG